LEREVSLLERDLSYVEKIARERYGMVKEREIVYKVSK
ncbi:MAG: septum formation initiator family protein, partial [Candidatus Latescibacteria bacterium]|nr:septum formation initiator family protein [Candidatus Latescibacterota bacterium]